MLAVVEIAGTQFEVEANSTYNVPLLAGNPGDTVEFSNILLVDDNGSTKLGTPYLEGNVKAKIVEHGRGDKILVFHKKRRKGYRKLNGHRQDYTSIEITNISINN
ncbi:MAG: 50S ribosomal protein L21 [Candidatus Kapaibacterium sp.]|jgi:large subunit ribosomal protein L21|nr:50S ribosomal protein L21 [Candidatus Kapabacteria bacterium]